MIIEKETPEYEMSCSLHLRTKNEAELKRFVAVSDNFRDWLTYFGFGIPDGNTFLLEDNIIDTTRYFCFLKSKQQKVEEFITQELKDFRIDKKVKLKI